MKNFIFFVTLFFIALAGCQQDHEMAIPTDPDPPVTPQEPPVSLIHTITSGNETSVYEYDEMDRRIKSAYNDGSKSETEYLEGLAILRIYKADGSLDYFSTFEINQEGLRAKRTLSNNSGFTEWFDYDQDHHLIKNNSINGNDTYEGNNFYSNGNLDSTIYFRNNMIAYTYKYTYLTDKPNTINNLAYGNPSSGKDSQNLLKNWTGYNTNGQIFISASFAYTYDNKGRVATQTQVTSDQVTTFVYTYY